MNFSSDDKSLSLDKADEADPPQPSLPPDGSEISAGRQASLDLEIVHLAGDWSGFGAAGALVKAAGAAVSRQRACRNAMPAAAAVALSSDAHIIDLNRRHRGADKPTNVLSFPNSDDGVFSPEAGRKRYLGDIVLAAETIAREARLAKIAADDHLQHLVVHGLLHLIGYDHESDDEARQMESLEVEILAEIHIADPYAARDLPPAEVGANQIKRI